MLTIVTSVDFDLFEVIAFVTSQLLNCVVMIDMYFHVLPDYYDAVVSNGAFAPGHINEECYEELARITQRGQLNQNSLD